MKHISVSCLLLCFFIAIVNFLLIACGDDDDDGETPTATQTSVPTATPTPQPDADIMPGVKMYDLFLGDPFNTCRDRFGDPFISGSSVSPDGHCIITVHYQEIGLTLTVHDIDCDQVLDDSDLIEQISVGPADSSYTGTTYGGNGLGSLLESIHNEFGECEWYIDWGSGQARECHYYTRGIDWYLTYPYYPATEIWIYKPEE